MKTPSKNSGFTLIEVTLGLMIFSVIAYAAITYMTRQASISAFNSFALGSAERFAVYNAGIHSFATATLDSIPEDTRQGLQVTNQLMPNGHLPSDFAECRNGAFGCSTWNQLMRAWGIKDEDDVFRAVITYRTLAASASLLATDVDASGDNYDPAYLELARAIANEAEEIGLVAGIIPPNELTAEVMKGRGSVDISAYEPATRDFARPVIFYGWPEFNQFPGGTDNNNNNGGGSGENYECNIDRAHWLAGSGWHSGQCLSAGFEQVASIPACRRTEGSVYGLGIDGSTITQGAYTRETPSYVNPQCFGCPSYLTDVSLYNQLILNRATVGSPILCENLYYSNNGGTSAPRRYAGPPFPDDSVTHAYCCTSID
jgi:prepilin-type N-terminal cleavage/methylation domain-containing protein